MKHVNEVTLIGHVGKDININEIGKGEKCANFSVATSNGWKDKETGEWINFTEWHKVVVFNQVLVTLCESTLKTGMLVYIRGELKTRDWKRKDGNDTKVTEIVLKNFKGELGILEKMTKAEDAPSERSRTSRKQAAPATSTFNDLDDEIPF